MPRTLWAPTFRRENKRRRSNLAQLAPAKNTEHFSDKILKFSVWVLCVLSMQFVWEFLQFVPANIPLSFLRTRLKRSKEKREYTTFGCKQSQQDTVRKCDNQQHTAKTSSKQSKQASERASEMDKSCVMEATHATSMQQIKKEQEESSNSSNSSIRSSSSSSSSISSSSSSNNSKTKEESKFSKQIASRSSALTLCSLAEALEMLGRALALTGELILNWIMAFQWSNWLPMIMSSAQAATLAAAAAAAGKSLHARTTNKSSSSNSSSDKSNCYRWVSAHCSLSLFHSLFLSLYTTLSRLLLALSQISSSRQRELAT